MNKLTITLILIAIFNYKTLACINGESLLLKSGTLLFIDRKGQVPYGHHYYREDFKKGIKQLDSLYKVTKDIGYLSDKGILLILLKKYDEAIKLYLDIEKNHPGRYSTASNIGTAYELIGENDNALQWIKKAVKIDPQSHNNSEWIHVKILEAKIKGPDFYTTTFLLNTDFGKETFPKTTLTRDSLNNLSYALYYQLNERVSFVKPKEKIVAQLLFDLGNAAFLLGKYNDAIADYEQARKYGFDNNLIEVRIKESERLAGLPKYVSKTLVKKKVKSNYFVYGVISIGILIFTTFIIYKRRKRTTGAG